MDNQNHICNICGKPMNIFDKQNNFFIQNEQVGYGSEHDGTRLSLHICCECMDAIISNCLVNPIEDKNE